MKQATARILGAAVLGAGIVMATAGTAAAAPALPSVPVVSALPGASEALAVGAAGLEPVADTLPVEFAPESDEAAPQTAPRTAPQAPQAAPQDAPKAEGSPVNRALEPLGRLLGGIPLLG